MYLSLKGNNMKKTDRKSYIKNGIHHFCRQTSKLLKKIISKIKHITKLLIPFGLLKLHRYVKSKTFSGVYNKLNEVPMLNNAYRHQAWIEKICKNSQKAIADIAKDTKALPVALEESRHHEFLPFLVSILNNTKKRCKILDFGGGAGVGYIDCLRYTNLLDFEFHIVETPELFSEAKSLFKSDERILMYDSMPDLGEVDIVNIGSALQYIDNYSELLSELLDKNPRFVLLTNHYMGDNKTYATQQVNMPDVIVPYLIFNLKEITEQISSKGYSLVFKTTNSQNHRFDVPDKYKVENSCNLLFSKDSS